MSTFAECFELILTFSASPFGSIKTRLERHRPDAVKSWRWASSAINFNNNIYTRATRHLKYPPWSFHCEQESNSYFIIKNEAQTELNGIYGLFQMWAILDTKETRWKRHNKNPTKSDVSCGDV